MIFPLLFLHCFLLVVGASPSLHNNELSFPDFLRPLYDLEALALLPKIGEQTCSFTSYNRSSRYNKEKDTYEDWDYNVDYLDNRTPDSQYDYNYIRKEKDELVFVDQEGPGVITMVDFITNINYDGILKIYIDDNTTPKFEMTPLDFFQKILKPDLYNNISYYQVSGWFGDGGGKGPLSFLPIPFEHSLKITGTDSTTRFFKFHIKTFPKGTKFKSFDLDMLKVNSDEIKKVNQLLSVDAKEMPVMANTKEHILAANLAPSKQTNLIIDESSKAIKLLKVIMSEEFFSHTGPEQEQILRGLVLRIFWDKDSFASVETPLGDFFGTGPGFNKYNSLMSGVIENTLYSNWVMPFESGARIEVENQSPFDVKFEMVAMTGTLSKKIGEYGRFHAKWHDGPFGPALKSSREVDFPLLVAEGTRGRFCGVMLNVFDANGGWWGEGDEKFFVDGEKSPSFHGTGSEDYFGYIWCGSILFEMPYSAQTRNDLTNTGHISVVRYHIADNVPFQKSFAGYIENYSLNRNGDMQIPYRAIPYWYQEKSRQDHYVLPEYKERAGYYNYEDIAWTQFTDVGGVEVESIIKDIKSSSQALVVKGVIPQRFEDGSIVEISGYTVARWQGKEGDHITLPLSSLTGPGVYNLCLKVADAKGSPRGRSRGTFLFEGGREPATIELPDKRESLLLSPQMFPPRVIDLGVFDITDNSSLKITMIGMGAQYMDLDFIFIERVQRKSRTD